MSIENDATLEFYAKHADLYQQRNAQDYTTAQGLKDDEVHSRYILESLEGLPKEARLFEVGSGCGRDAALIRARGYQVQTSDAVESFLDILKENGFAPIKFNLISDTFPDQYDYILANAVLVHFTKGECREVLRKVYNALNPGGIFAFSLKQYVENAPEWKSNIPGSDSKRYFSYWKPEEIEAELKLAGFKIKKIQQDEGMRANWLNIIAQK